MVVNWAVLLILTMILSGCIFPYWWDDGGGRGGGHGGHEHGHEDHGRN